MAIEIAPRGPAGFAGDEERQRELVRMQRLATGLLVLVTLIFVGALLLQERYPWMNFIRATAEAAMVGAIADWFAVTALFRHPLGLPIPHTAIIPRRKDSIGMSIGQFVQDNFLSPDVIAPKLRSVDVARRVARLVVQPEASARVAKLVAAGIVAVLQVVNDDDVQGVIERGVVTRAQRINVAPLAGRVLGVVLSGPRQADLLYGMIKLAAQVMDENKDAIRERISRETPWWLPKSIDNRIYRRVFDTVVQTLGEVSADPEHPLHDKFNSVVSRLIEDLQHNPDTIARLDEFKEELLAQPLLREFAASLWADLKALLLRQSATTRSYLFASTQRIVTRLGGLMLYDESLAAKVNDWVERIAVYAVREYGHEFGQLIAQTVSNWDTADTTRKIELQIGRDLQFIRINGTVVGGIVGLLIYSVSLLIG